MHRVQHEILRRQMGSRPSAHSMLLRQVLAVCVAALVAGGACQRASAQSPADRTVVSETVMQAPDDAARLALETERVVIFKDGYGLFLERATGTLDENGLVYTDEVPDAAVLGSFWASAGDAAMRMRADHVDTRVRSSEEVTAASVGQLLAANVGERVSLKLRDEPEMLDARIVELLTHEPDLDAVEPMAPDAARPVVLDPGAGRLALLETDDGMWTVHVDQIVAVRGEKLATTLTREEVRVERRKRLVFDFGQARAGDEVELDIMYFRPGVRWIPTYRFDGTEGEGTARLALQAELLNEAEDISAAEIDLVVGVPNFRFKDVVSPLVLEAQLKRTLQQAAPSVMGQSNTFDNALYVQRSSEWRGQSSGGGGGGAIVDGMKGEGASDLFVYSAGTLSIDRGARVTVPLWSQSVDRRDVYTLDLAPSLVQQYGHARQSSPLELADTEVWHQLELTNEGDQPWTTGAAMLLEGDMPLAQELLTYTPPGTTTRVPVTVAVDVRGAWQSAETERETSAKVVDGVHYTRIVQHGTIDLVNHREESSTIQVELAVDGKAHDATDGGEVKLDPYGAFAYSAVNPRSTVTWEVELDPGESTTLEVDVETFTR